MPATESRDGAAATGAISATPAGEPHADATMYAAAEVAAAHCFVDRLDSSVTVDGPDGHHLQRVRRLRTGEFLTAADGAGRWRRYVIVGAEPGRSRPEADASERQLWHGQRAPTKAQVCLREGLIALGRYQ